LPKEENPFLGVRGIRYSLEEEKLFREQIISILTSKLIDKVKIMFPMVAVLDDFIKAKNIVAEESEKLKIKSPALGIMVETPSAALNAELFVGHVNFFSIGTNDLIQYTYAADRGLASLNKYQDPLDTGVLKLINNVIEVGVQHNIEVSVCGDMASDKDAAVILYLLGLRVFSIAPSQGPNIINSLVYAKNNLSHVTKEEILSSLDSHNLRNLIS
jgi:phosphotransferase system enzyme I (PtsI)